VLFSGWYWLNNDVPALDALRIVTFSVVSVVTTTGFAVDDYTQWGGFAVMAFFYLTFIGGCSGSTSGGLKMFRFQVAYSLLRANFKQLIHPRAVIRQQYNGHNLDEEIVRSILTFSFFITMTIGVLALCLALLGLDPITALTGARPPCATSARAGRDHRAGRQLLHIAGHRQVAAVDRHAARPPGNHHRAGATDPGLLASLIRPRRRSRA